jgi:heat shock protein 5
MRDGRVEILTNDQGNRITPSWVAFTDEERLVGEAAKNQFPSNPRNTIFDAKRLIGRRMSEKEVVKDIKNFPFKVVNKDNQPRIIVDVKGEEKTFSPEEVSAMVLGKMKEVAENYLVSLVVHGLGSSFTTFFLCLLERRTASSAL